MRIALFLFLVLPCAVMAGGGKSQNPVADNDCTFIPPAVGVECVELPAPGHSGSHIYVCDALVICNGEPDDGE